MNVLVAYASKRGSTAEIAERIAATLRDAGCNAEARRAGDVQSLTGYDAVVLGSAIYAVRWRREARHFARHHRHDLARMPVWLFSSGPLGAVEDHPSAPEPGYARDLSLRIRARDHVVFGGRVPVEPHGFVERSMARRTPERERDARDWPQIDAWARGIAHDLTTGRPVAAHH